MKAVICLAVIALCVVPCSAKGNDTAMKIFADGVKLPVQWEDNRTVEALRNLAPLTVKMSAYGGFEQVGRLGVRLPRDDVRITTEPGDIVLYAGNQIVMFHGNNTWEYTKLGHVTGKTHAELAEILGKPSVTLTISAD
ncbi:MAG: hypothetical protein IJR63_01670 [Synergistaceae bacterium]|nr:hypothetical protein [Synergistaceae bacterium]